MGVDHTFFCAEELAVVSQYAIIKNRSMESQTYLRRIPGSGRRLDKERQENPLLQFYYFPLWQLCCKYTDNIQTAFVLDCYLLTRDTKRGVKVPNKAALLVLGPPYIRAMSPVKAVAGSDTTVWCPYYGFPIE